MQICDEILPSQTVTFFWTLNDDEQELPALKQMGPTTALPQGEHQAQGAAAFPEGISISCFQIQSQKQNYLRFYVRMLYKAMLCCSPCVCCFPWHSAPPGHAAPPWACCYPGHAAPPEHVATLGMLLPLSMLLPRACCSPPAMMLPSRAWCCLPGHDAAPPAMMLPPVHDAAPPGMMLPPGHDAAPRAWCCPPGMMLPSRAWCCPPWAWCCPPGHDAAFLLMGLPLRPKMQPKHPCVT